MPGHETSISFQEIGKLVGRDTSVTKFSVFKDNLTTMRRETSSEIVNTENVERTGNKVKEKFRSIILDAADKSKTVGRKLSGEWRKIKSKFPDGYQKHVVITAGIVVCIVCCYRLIL